MSRRPYPPLVVVVFVAGAYLLGFATALWFDKEAIRERGRHAAEIESLAEQLDQLDKELAAALADQSEPADQHDQAADADSSTVKELRVMVVGVTDGDTITVLAAMQRQEKVRLSGIDAPERRQAFAARAKQSLSGKALGKEIVVKWKKRDRYGRIIGDVYVGDSWINLEMVAEGFAWHFKKYDQRPELDKAEKEARADMRGLWDDPNPLAPWEHRARQKAQPPPGGKSTPALFWLNTSSGVRHNQGCDYFQNTKKGRFCGSDEGKPCGRCGG